MTTTTLITGATGTIGNQVARELLKRGGLTVRVGTRQPEAAADLQRIGAEVVRLDLDAADTLAEAFAGVDRVFLVGPQSSQDFGERVGAVVAAAKQANIKFVLRLSALGAAVDSGFIMARQHGVAEKHVAESNIPWSILQPTFFQDNLLKFQGQAIAGQGAFYGASGEGKTAYVSSADIARSAAAILLDPVKHAAKRYVLTGPEAISDAELAKLVSDVIRKAVNYIDLPPEKLGASMREQGMPDWIVESMLALEAVKANGYAADVSAAVEQITGRAPETYRSFLERNRTRFV
ncbi:MAG TPA: SDR family oxidoreductase [Polyangiaceae bacterium]|nr:SDR family oxidoreductase [Polyangiaceae bacterium]HMR74359.1 SDR family oxidoreductase [Polyangiaceae bacterium]